MRKETTQLHPSLVAMCKELGLDCAALQRSLEETEQRQRRQRREPPKGTPGRVLLEFFGAWDMSDEEWDGIYKDIRAMREMTE